jgi:hypothetical protein
MSIDRLIGRLPVAGCQLLRPASRRGGHHGLSQCVASAFAKPMADGVVLLPGAFPESEGIRGPKCGKSRKILSYSRLFPGIPACSRILGIFFCFLGKIGRRAETATPYRRTNAATEAFARGCFHTGKGAPGAICSGHRPPLQPKVGIPGRKVEFFPAISAFSAFDRLWGMFFCFWENETESPRSGFAGLPPSPGFGAASRRDKENTSAFAQTLRHDRENAKKAKYPGPIFGTLAFPYGHQMSLPECKGASPSTSSGQAARARFCQTKPSSIYDLRFWIWDRKGRSRQVRSHRLGAEPVGETPTGTREIRLRTEATTGQARVLPNTGARGIL